MSRSNRQRGSSLVEALVALAIVAVVMTVGMALLAQETDVDRRLRAQREATEVVESALESVRAGFVPLASGRLELPVTSDESDAMTLWMEVTPRETPPGLFEVEVEARYVVGPRTLRRTVRTMIWSPS